MEYILLLTACINPDGMPFTCLADVGVRKKQYIEALNFYLKNWYKAQRKAKFYINNCRSASCMQGGLKQASA